MRPCRLRFPYIPVILVLSIAMGGCAVPGNVRNGESSAVQMEKNSARQEQMADLSAENVRLQRQLAAARAEITKTSRQNKSLQDGIEVVNGVREIEARTFIERLAAMETARDDAVREVVRTRARIQGMASPAEAAAMFAEARVIIDRMNEDAFNEPARDYLNQGRKFLKNGQQEMERQNPGGAAYLFDLISTLYESFRGIDSRALTVNTLRVNLRAMPDPSSKKLGLLSHGEKVSGQEKRGVWIQVRTTSGLQGWIHSKYLQ